jgi:hypothetical protein
VDYFLNIADQRPKSQAEWTMANSRRTNQTELQQIVNESAL